MLDSSPKNVIMSFHKTFVHPNTNYIFYGILRDLCPSLESPHNQYFDKKFIKTM